MSQHNTSVSPGHMLDHAFEAAAMAEGKTRADLDQPELTLPQVMESARKR